VEHGKQSLLRAKYGIDEDGIFKGVKELVGFHQNQTETSIRRVFPNPE
jgi:hypothetical protein